MSSSSIRDSASLPASAVWRPLPLADVAGALPRFVVAVAVVALALLALAVRLPGLIGPDGTLNADEARLALAADGVLQSGLPAMPTGRVYTRGLLNTYIIAGSFALFGRHDAAARLPSVVAGALLVPAVFLLGRAFGGTAAGLAAAAFVAIADLLVYYARTAWLPSVYLLLFTVTLYGCYRGFVEGRGHWQLGAALAFIAALLSYEFAMLIVLALALTLGIEGLRRRRDWYQGRTTLLALGIFIGGVVLFGLLTLVLRAGTLAGPLGEAEAFFQPRPRLSGLVYYARELLFDYAVLALLAALALPLLLCERPRGTLLLVILFGLVILFPSFVIQLQRSPRYALPVLPLLAVLAAAAVTRGVAALGRWRGWSGLRLQLAAWLGLLLLFGAALARDIRAIPSWLHESAPRQTWVQAIQRAGFKPTDLVVSESSQKARFYLGRADFDLRPINYRRYAYRSPEGLRYIYTGALLLTTRGDFERLVERPNAGRVVWIVGRAERLPETLLQLDPQLWPALSEAADKRIRTADGWLLLRLTLPRQRGG